MRLAGFQNVLYFGVKLNVQNRVGFCDSVPDLAGGLTTLPKIPQSLGTSCFRQSQLRTFDACNLPDSHVLVYVLQLIDLNLFLTGPPYSIPGSAISLDFDVVPKQKFSSKKSPPHQPQTKNHIEQPMSCPINLQLVHCISSFYAHYNYRLQDPLGFLAFRNPAYKSL